MKYILLMLSCALLVSACKSGTDDEGGNVIFGDGDAQGKVHDKNFTVRSGRTFKDFNNPEQWILELHEQTDNNPCSTDLPPVYSITFKSPKSVGDYPVSNSRPVSFLKQVSGGVQVNVSTNGAIKIESIAEGYIFGRVASVFNDENQINGEFRVHICD